MYSRMGLRLPTSTCFSVIRFMATSASSKKSRKEMVPFIEAARMLKALEVASPYNVLELHIKCRLERGSAPIRGKVQLPRDVRKTLLRVLVLADVSETSIRSAAQEAGADIVGGEELIKDIKEEKLIYDKCICTPAIFPFLQPLARQLGPKGLMPSVKRGTVTEEVGTAVREAKGLFEFRTDKQGVIHTGIARLGFSLDEIGQNISVIVSEIKELGKNAEGKKKGSSSIIESAHLSSTRGPGIPVDLSSI